MTVLQTRRFTLVLVAQVVVCLSVAPVVAAKLAVEPKTHQQEPAPNHDAAFQAARDAANVRPEEVSDRQNDPSGRPISGLKTHRVSQPQQSGGSGSGATVSDDGALGCFWSPLLCPDDQSTQTVARQDGQSASSFEVGTCLQPTGPPLRN